MRDRENEMRIEEQRSLLTEEEWPTPTEDISYYWYASKAINKIEKAYNSGEILENGVVFWY